MSEDSADQYLSFQASNLFLLRGSSQKPNRVMPKEKDPGQKYGLSLHDCPFRVQFETQEAVLELATRNSLEKLFSISHI